MLRFKTKGVVSTISSILLILFGVVLFAGSKPANDTIFTKDDALSGDIQVGEVYDFGEVIIADEYATTTYEDNTPTAHYYLALIPSEENSYIAFSLQVKEDESIYQTLKAYVEDSESLVGDMKLPVCAVAYEFGLNNDNEISGFYNDSITQYKEVVTINSQLDKSFSYKFATADSYEDYKKEDSKDTKILKAISVLLLIGGLAMLIMNIRYFINKKK